MIVNQSHWQSEESANAFLQGVRSAIPAASLQLELIDHIVRSWCPHPRCILDLGCGDGALGRFLLDRYPDARVIFADFSDPMLEAAQKQLENRVRASIIKVDFSSPSWMDTIGFLESIDVVVSGFAIHHQPDLRKKALYSEIFTMVNSGGVFLNLEHVASATPSGENLFDNYFIDHLYEFHRANDPSKSREEIAHEHYNRPDKAENILAPVQAQCAWLREIGFADVDCFFKIFELALFGGRKSSKTIAASGE
ncbi:MAG: class I SAM-dependent methyltransferase [Geobacteraceae bacterium]|nr:class I SAM-dependent methyltransferase [Geobacteraceae bacterium]